jgi:AraC family transcriptional regulator of adaptative response / DNA-3-methyladenine glycosylase II
VERALALIDAGALDRDGIDALACRLGIGPRHLSRLFAEHLDASPAQIALSSALIAERAGFSSARRMSAAFAQLYGRPPSTLRRTSHFSYPA